MSQTEWMVVAFIALVMIGSIAGAGSKRKRKRSKPRKLTKTTTSTAAGVRRASTTCRSDEVILSSRLDDISGAEFERLMALYFKDKGYAVKEVGVGGSDGGVDLVITDKRGEKTAVQAKCYADHNKVSVQVVRELVGAKRNHDCVLTLLVTTSDLTSQAKKEAEQFKVDYWHGGVIETKLANWGRWKPGKNRRKSSGKAATALGEIGAAWAQTAAASSASASAKRSTTDMACKCGAKMVKRTNKEGAAFWGCSTFPKCKHTKAAT